MGQGKREKFLKYSEFLLNEIIINTTEIDVMRKLVLSIALKF